jgi:hypothetical protein
LVDGRLELSGPDALDENPRPVVLGAELDRPTPRIDIPDLLAKAQNSTGSPATSPMLPAPARGLLHLQQHLQGATLAGA